MITLPESVCQHPVVEEAIRALRDSGLSLGRDDYQHGLWIEDEELMVRAALRVTLAVLNAADAYGLDIARDLEMAVLEHAA